MTVTVNMLMIKMTIPRKITVEMLLLRCFLSHSPPLCICWCCTNSITSSRSFPAKWAAARWDQSTLVIPVAAQTTAGPEGSSRLHSQGNMRDAVFSAAHITQNIYFLKRKISKKETEMNAGSSTGEASISGTERRESVEGFEYAHIQSVHKYTRTRGNSQIPKTPLGVCSVITEQTNHFLDQSLLVAQWVYSV